MSTKFDEWLEGELVEGFATVNSRPVPTEPRYHFATTPTWRNPMSMFFSVFSPSRALAPLVAAGLILGGGAAAAGATGTNPLAFGQQVSDAVVTCKAGL